MELAKASFSLTCYTHSNENVSIGRHLKDCGSIVYKTGSTKPAQIKRCRFVLSRIRKYYKMGIVNVNNIYYFYSILLSFSKTYCLLLHPITTSNPSNRPIFNNSHFIYLIKNS
jgi:hypothetical protein